MTGTEITDDILIYNITFIPDTAVLFNPIYGDVTDKQLYKEIRSKLKGGNITQSIAKTVIKQFYQDHQYLNVEPDRIIRILLEIRQEYDENRNIEDEKTERHEMQRHEDITNFLFGIGSPSSESSVELSETLPSPLLMLPESPSPVKKPRRKKKKKSKKKRKYRH
jgi:hypothetical protein